MSAEQLKIVFEHETLNAESVLKAISTILEKHGIPLTEFSFEGRTIDLLSALPLLQKSKRKSFHLVGQDFEFLYGSVGNCRLDFLQIRSAAPLLYWDDWVTGFADSPHFVMAWVVDREYDFWQNADDPLEYTAVGKPYHHLPMKSNDL